MTEKEYKFILEGVNVGSLLAFLDDLKRAYIGSLGYIKQVFDVIQVVERIEALRVVNGIKDERVRKVVLSLLAAKKEEKHD